MINSSDLIVVICKPREVHEKQQREHKSKKTDIIMEQKSLSIHNSTKNNLKRHLKSLNVVEFIEIA